MIFIRIKATPWPPFLRGNLNNAFKLPGSEKNVTIHQIVNHIFQLTKLGFLTKVVYTVGIYLYYEKSYIKYHILIHYYNNIFYNIITCGTPVQLLFRKNYQT